MKVTKAKVVAALTFVVGLANAIIVPLQGVDTSTKVGLATGSGAVIIAALSYVLAQLGQDVKDAGTQAAAMWHVLANASQGSVPACDCGKHLHVVNGGDQAS